MATRRPIWPWILCIVSILLLAGIGFAGYSIHRVGLVVRDAYSAENASLSVAKFIDKHERPPGSWQELDSSIREACAETEYNYEDVIEYSRIDFVLLNDATAWTKEAKFVTTETGAYFGSPTPDGRILEQLQRLKRDSKDP